MLARGASDIFDDLLARAFACSSCLSHVPLLSGYDEPKTLSYQIPLFGPIGADVKQVLRLLETFEMDVVQGAIRHAIDLGAIGYDAVKHLVLCRIEKRPPRLDLDFYPYLPKANVGTTRASSYMSLIGGSAA